MARPQSGSANGYARGVVEGLHKAFAGIRSESRITRLVAQRLPFAAPCDL